MRLIAYTSEREDMMGALLDGRIAPVASVDAFYADVAGHLAAARRATEGCLTAAEAWPAVPVPALAKVVCAAINYVAHGAESKLPTPTVPNLFARWRSQLVVDGTDVPVPRSEPDGVDWEVEIAAIVGRTLIDATPAEAEAGILGYTVFNDVSARAQLEMMALGTGQWALGKNADASGPIGSVLVTADEAHPRDLRLTAEVDGTIVQDGSGADMVFGVGELAAFISRTVTLRPGDVIATGTPAGVGFGRNPRVYMKPGSVLRSALVGICEIENRIVGAEGRR